MSKVIRMVCPERGFATVDDALPDEPGEAIFERKRPVLSGDGDLLVQLVQKVAPDMLPGAITHHQQLCRGHATARDPGNERLHEDRGERRADFLPDRRLPLGRK